MSDTEIPDTPARHHTSYLRRVLQELGLRTVFGAPGDIKLLILQRFVRCLAYGFSTLILVSFFEDQGYRKDQIGFFMTLTLVGDVCISLCLTAIADGLGRRTVLALGSAMMAGSGVVFALSGNYWVLLAAAVFGVISPSGQEIGPFRAVEESTIAWLASKEDRRDIYAWYSLLGSAGIAIGTLSCGWIVQSLLRRPGWDTVQAYRAVFFIYSALGITKLVLSFMLSVKCEVERPEPSTQSSEADPLLPSRTEHAKKPRRLGLLPSIARDSLPTVLKLAMLFAVDSFASGLVSMTWVVSFFRDKFGLPEGTLGTIFSITNIIAALSMLVASAMAKRFGNVKTMVFTHLPSAIFLAMIPIPAELPLALTFMILRSCSQSMDTAPRSAFLAAVLRPTERTAIMGFFTILKTASGAVAPTVTGVLAKMNYFWVVFIVAGSLKASYDIGLLLVFATTEKEQEERSSREES